VTLKRGLGRGIDALIPREEAAPEGPGENENAGGNKPQGAELFIPLEKLRANPEQPRKNFDHGELEELADSIREHGVIQPIIVEEREEGTYTIVAGERRTRAAKLAGLTEIPALVRKYSDEKRMAVSLIENIQRSGLNPMEEALAYKRLMELTGLSQDEAAAKVGKNRSTVANALRLLKLPYEMQESIQEGDISPGHARAILSIPGVKGQDLLFREILKKNLSVREAERRAAALSGEAKKAAQPRDKPKGRAPELDAMEEKFITRLGTKVVVNGNLNKGSIVIDYYSMEDLDRLYEILG
jgi:ParB family chromosome partitioning protein